MHTRRTLALTMTLMLGLTGLNAPPALALTPPDLTAGVSRATATPAGAWLSTNGMRISGFDPGKGTQTVNSTGVIQLHDLPAGWTVMAQTRTGGVLYVLSDGNTTCNWWINGATDLTHTTDELRSLKLTHNNQALDVDVTVSQDLHDFTGGSSFGYDNLAPGWTMSGSWNDDWTVMTYTLHPDNASTPRLTYTFHLDHKADTIDGVTAWLDDGSPVTGFNPTATSGTPIPRNHKVSLANLPAGWSWSTLGETASRIVLKLTGPQGETRNLIFPKTDSYTWTWHINMLHDLNARLDDGTTVNGFDYTGGAWTIPANTRITLDNLPDGWIVERETTDDGFTLHVKDPDNTIQASYRFQYDQSSVSTDELKDVRALAGGQPVKGFDPTRDGDYGIAYGSSLGFEGLPDDWTMSRDTEPDGTIRVTIGKQDTTVTWTLHIVWTVNDLNTVHALADGRPVSGFDPTESGVWTYPEGAQLEITGIPDPVDRGSCGRVAHVAGIQSGRQGQRVLGVHARPRVFARRSEQCDGEPAGRHSGHGIRPGARRRVRRARRHHEHQCRPSARRLDAHAPDGRFGLDADKPGWSDHGRIPVHAADARHAHGHVRPRR